LSTVFFGLEESAKILAKNIAEETVHTVQFKWVLRAHIVSLLAYLFLCCEFVYLHRRAGIWGCGIPSHICQLLHPSHSVDNSWARMFV